MNDVTLKELKIVVERAVRPVRATMARKRKMREELLAHLVAIFEEEAESLGDDQAALDQAKRRFGDPAELTPQLQETVPRWDWLVRLGEVGPSSPGESWLSVTGKITILTLATFAAVAPIVLPAMFLGGRQRECVAALYVFLVIGALSIPFTLAFVLLTDGMYRALYRKPSDRSWRLATIYGLASLFIFPVFAFVWYWSLTGDLAMSCTRLLMAWCFAPLAPVLFAVMARQTAEQMRYYEEWASLEIGQ